MNTYRVGLSTERQALRFLQAHIPDLQLLAARFVAKGGEIDLVVEVSRQLLIFVEVRSRYSKRTLDPVLSLSEKKIRRIKKAAAYFLDRYQGCAQECQFDFVVYDLGNWHRYPDYF